MSLLRTILGDARERVRRLPAGEPAPAVHRGRFRNALRGRGRLSVIAEVKRKSPSRGALDLGAEAPTRALAYQSAGAAAVSVLTEPGHFGGSLEDLERVAATVGIPVLMKDFVVSPEQVRVAALLGASAFLVIVRVTDDVLMRELVQAGIEYGLDALLEVHTLEELERADAFEGVLGVNNRDLDTLAVDRGNALRLAPHVPGHRVAVAESGYGSPRQLAAVQGSYDGALVGSALMEAADPGAFLREVCA